MTGFEITVLSGMTGFKITAFAVSGTGKGFSGKMVLFYRLLKNMSSSVSSKTRYWVLALAAIVLDQWSKWAVLSSFQYRERVNVIPSFFDLTLVYNPGAAFSFLADQGGWQKYFFGAGGGGERVFGTRHLAR